MANVKIGKACREPWSMRAVAQTGSNAARSLHAYSTKRNAIMKTDKQLQTDVIAELSWEPSVHAAEIGVEVKEGVVTLAGHVGSYAEKWNAERAAQRVSGVKALAVEMDVKLPAFGQRTDADIAKSASNMLSWASSVPDDAIKVVVENAWITLSGAVDWQFQKQAATDAVRFLIGVKGVSDQIAIKPTVTMRAVKADIEAALNRRATRDAKKISVSVDGDDVTLTGTVHSYAERELATNSAWGTPGVRNVVDEMTLSY
jgi:osmotically-inducible protein OsmY